MKSKWTWYIKLNILVLSFLFVVFLIYQTSREDFRRGLQVLFSSEGVKSAEPQRPVKIRPEF